MSSWLLLFGLGVAWAAVLVPDFVRRNAHSRRSDTIGQFSRNLSSLDRSAPVLGGRSNVIDLRDRDRSPRVSAQTPLLVAGGQPRTRSQQRRKDVMSALVAAALVSFLASMSLGGIATTVHLIIDVLLVAYIGALLSVTKRERTRARVGSFYAPNVQPMARPTAQMGRTQPVMAQRQRIAR